MSGQPVPCAMVAGDGEWYALVRGGADPGVPLAAGTELDLAACGNCGSNGGTTSYTLVNQVGVNPEAVAAGLRHLFPPAVVAAAALTVRCDGCGATYRIDWQPSGRVVFQG